MKRNYFIPFVFVTGLFVSCNNSQKNMDPLQVKADSLEKEVMAGHNVAMPKSMKIPKLQKEIGQTIDSINKLPAREQRANAPYKIKLESLNKDLSAADSVMQKWMLEYVPDTFSNNAEQRIKYLSNEKIKIDKVKNVVLSSLQKADSLLKKGH